MYRHLSTTVLVVTLAAALAACGSSSATKAAGGATTSSAPAGTNPNGGVAPTTKARPATGGSTITDPCSIVTAAQVSAAFGVTFTAGVRDDTPPSVSCKWRQEGADADPLGTYNFSIDVSRSFGDGLKFIRDRQSTTPDANGNYYQDTKPLFGRDSVWEYRGFTKDKAVELTVLTASPQLLHIILNRNNGVDVAKAQAAMSALLAGKF